MQHQIYATITFSWPRSSFPGCNNVIGEVVTKLDTQMIEIRGCRYIFTRENVSLLCNVYLSAVASELKDREDVMDVLYNHVNNSGLLVPSFTTDPDMAASVLNLA